MVVQETLCSLYFFFHIAGQPTQFEMHEYMLPVQVVLQHCHLVQMCLMCGAREALEQTALQCTEFRIQEKKMF